jgi:hypothetical protein
MTERDQMSMERRAAERAEWSTERSDVARGANEKASATR